MIPLCTVKCVPAPTRGCCWPSHELGAGGKPGSYLRLAGPPGPGTPLLSGLILILLSSQD